MRLHSNEGKMLITHQAHLSGYKPHVRFDQKSIINIISLKNIIKQYHANYNSLDNMFIVHSRRTRK